MKRYLRHAERLQDDDLRGFKELDIYETRDKTNETQTADQKSLTRYEKY